MVKQESPKFLDEGSSPSVPAKICSTCKELKDIDDFAVNTTKKGGRSYICKLCHKKYNAQHYINNKDQYKNNRTKRRDKHKEFFHNIKKNLKCDNCGETRWYVLDFHHNEGDKEFNISTWFSSGLSIERFKKELEKCSVLCSNCHRELHFLENNIL